MIEKGPQKEQLAEDGTPLARGVRRDHACQPGPEGASRFHKEETARDLTHAFSLGGDCPPPPMGRNWFWGEESKKLFNIIIVYGPLKLNPTQ